VAEWVDGSKDRDGDAGMGRAIGRNCQPEELECWKVRFNGDNWVCQVGPRERRDNAHADHVKVKC
jgi:hypothetical protein